MNKKALRNSAFAILLAVSPCSYGATDTQNNIGDVLDILVGAYNGAARAAAEHDGSTAQTINRSELAPLENTLLRYQRDIEGIVKPDGEVDLPRLGHFLNRLQSGQQGEINYDFARALTALAQASSKGNKQSFFDHQLLAELVASAKSRELKNELGQAAPYLGAILQLATLMNQDNPIDGKSTALNTEVDALRALAEHSRPQPGLAQDVAVAAAQLKVLYAEQALGEPLGRTAIEMAKSQLSQLERRVAAAPHTVSTADYDALLRPLSALGAPFVQQRDRWIALRAMSLQDRYQLPVQSGFDAPTRKLLDALNYDQLPPHVQKELLERLHISRID